MQSLAFIVAVYGQQPLKVKLFFYRGFCFKTWNEKSYIRGNMYYELGAAYVQTG